jgi:hypothetical protein
MNVKRFNKKINTRILKNFYNIFNSLKLIIINSLMNNNLKYMNRKVNLR